MKLFLSEQFRKQDKKEALEYALENAMVGLEVRGSHMPDFSVQMRAQPFNSSKILTLDADELCLARTDKLMCDLDDSFSLVTCNSGSVNVSFPDGNGTKIQTGIASLLSHQQPSAVSSNGQIKVNTIVLPRELIKKVIHDPDSATAEMPVGGLAAIGLLSGYLHNLVTQPEPLTPEMQKTTLGHLLDLIGHAYDPFGEWSRAEPNGGLNEARRQKIFEHMSRCYSDFDASAQTFAPQVGVSTRMVHRLLVESGKTFSEHLMNTRLEAAMSMLCDVSYNNTKVLDIALAAGFADISYFNRVFRQRYGDTPNTFRSRNIH